MYTWDLCSYWLVPDKQDCVHVPLNLEDHLALLLVSDNVNIRLLSDTDLVSNRVDTVAMTESLQGQVIISTIGQTVSII